MNLSRIIYIMKSTATKFIVVSVVCLLVGYVIGGFIGLPPITGGNAGGDIAKVSKFRMSKVSSQKSAFEEKLLSDTLELRKTAFSLLFLTSRMDEFSDLVALSEKAAGGNETLHPSLTRLSNMKELSLNAYNAGVEAADVLGQLAGGAKIGGGVVDQATENLTLAYLMVDRQLSAAKYFIAEVDSYLKGKSVAANAELAEARDKWVVYCATDAALNSDELEMAQWQDVTLLSAKEDLSSACNMIRNLEQVALNNSVWDTVIPNAGISLWAKEVPSANIKFQEAMNLNESLNLNLNAGVLANTNLADLRCIQCWAVAGINDLGSVFNMESIANAVSAEDLNLLNTELSNAFQASQLNSVNQMSALSNSFMNSALNFI